MTTLRCVVSLLGCAGILALGCQSPIKGCPEGFDGVRERSTPGKVLVCKSRDGTTQRWIELQDGTEKPRQICSFSGGRPAGEFRAFHPDGRDWLRGTYVDGAKSGVWTQLDGDGLKVAEGEYRTGQLVAGAPVGAPARCEALRL
jgi:hypothetical protein